MECVSFALAEEVKRKLNVASPALDDLELREFDPPESYRSVYEIWYSNTFILLLLCTLSNNSFVGLFKQIIP